jgi:orotate phosphoribosyltransferase
VDALFRIGALRFGSFTLSSGKRSSYYLDLRIVPSYPEVFSIVIGAYAEMVRQIKESSFDVIAGVATAGIAFSSPLAFLLRKPMVYVRHEGKGHGLERLVEGALVPGCQAILVDDLVTSGGSILSAAASLRREGCRVKEAIVLVDRMEGGKSNLSDDGIRLVAYVTIKELADYARQAQKITKKDYGSVLRQLGGPG